MIKLIVLNLFCIIATGVESMAVEKTNHHYEIL